MVQSSPEPPAAALLPSPASPVRVAVHSAGCRQREDGHGCTTFSGPVAGSPALRRVLLLWVSQDLVPILPTSYHSSLGLVPGLTISEAMGLAAVWAWVFAPQAQTTGVRLCLLRVLRAGW